MCRLCSLHTRSSMLSASVIAAVFGAAVARDGILHACSPVLLVVVAPAQAWQEILCTLLRACSLCRAESQKSMGAEGIPKDRKGASSWLLLGSLFSLMRSYTDQPACTCNLASHHGCLSTVKEHALEDASKYQKGLNPAAQE